MRTLSRTLLASLLLLSLHTRAEAHGLGAVAKLKDGRVTVECYFDDDTVAADARVLVADDSTTIAEGRTDAKGHWSFPAPAPGRYRVSVDGGGGHRAVLRLVIPVPEDPASEVVSDGPSREEFTQFPWLRLSVGIGVILILAVLVPRVVRAKREHKEAGPMSESGEGSPS